MLELTKPCGGLALSTYVLRDQETEREQRGFHQTHTPALELEGRGGILLTEKKWGERHSQQRDWCEQRRTWARQQKCTEEDSIWEGTRQDALVM